MELENLEGKKFNKQERAKKELPNLLVGFSIEPRLVINPRCTLALAVHFHHECFPIFLFFLFPLWKDGVYIVENNVRQKILVVFECKVKGHGCLSLTSRLTSTCFDDASKFVFLMSPKPSKPYLESEDFVPLIQVTLRSNYNTN